MALRCTCRQLLATLHFRWTLVRVSCDNAPDVLHGNTKFVLVTSQAEANVVPVVVNQASVPASVVSVGVLAKEKDELTQARA